MIVSFISTISISIKFVKEEDWVVQNEKGEEIYVLVENIENIK